MPTNDSLLAASRERAVLDKAASDAKAAVALTLQTSGGRAFGSQSFNSPLRLAQLIDGDSGSLGLSTNPTRSPAASNAGGLASLVAMRDEMNASWNSALDATMRTAQTNTASATNDNVSHHTQSLCGKGSSLRWVPCRHGQCACRREGFPCLLLLSIMG